MHQQVLPDEGADRRHHEERRDHHQPHDAAAYRKFLGDIGYLVPADADFQISTGDVDDEIAHIAGPQLVVPVKNARYALNAANARWGSLYDALYGTDVISEADGCDKGSGYNPKRGAKVIEYARYVLDQRQTPTRRATVYRGLNPQFQLGVNDLVAPELRKQFARFNGNFDRSFPPPKGLDEYRKANAKKIQDARLRMEQEEREAAAVRGEPAPAAPAPAPR